MKELAKEYKESAALLRDAIKKLERVKDFLCERTINPDKDPDIIELNERLRPLRNMLNDLNEVTKEIENYYERSWWRSGKYTCNQNKPKPAKCDEEILRFGFSISSNRKTKNSNKNVLHRRKNNARNSRNTRHIKSCC